MRKLAYVSAGGYEFWGDKDKMGLMPLMSLCLWKEAGFGYRKQSVVQGLLK